MLRETHTFARENLKKAATRQKRNYDQTASIRKFKVGDWVYHKDHVACKTKLGLLYKTRPFMVIKVRSDVNLDIQQSQMDRVITVHIDQIKRCFGKHPVSWISAENPTKCNTSNKSTQAANKSRNRRLATITSSSSDSNPTDDQRHREDQQRELRQVDQQCSNSVSSKTSDTKTGTRRVILQRKTKTILLPVSQSSKHPEMKPEDEDHSTSVDCTDSPDEIEVPKKKVLRKTRRGRELKTPIIFLDN